MTEFSTMIEELKLQDPRELEELVRKNSVLLSKEEAKMHEGLGYEEVLNFETGDEGGREEGKEDDVIE